MPNIAFIMLQEVSHYLPAFCLADKLKAEGHKICFVGIADFEDLVKKRGFDFFVVFEDLFPRGQEKLKTKQLRALAFPHHPQKKVSRLKKLSISWNLNRAAARELKRVIKLEFTGELSRRFIEKLKPQLLLVDSYLAIESISLWRFGIPILQLNVTLSTQADDGVPPGESYLIPLNNHISKLLIKLSWLKIKFKQKAFHLLLRLFGINYQNYLNELASHAKFPLAQRQRTGEVFTRISHPELIFCPQIFDFPRKQNDFLHFVEASIDKKREVQEFNWNKIDINKKLVFCAFGTQALQYKKFTEVINCLIGAARQLSDLQFVISIGEALFPTDFPNAPENTYLLSKAPQLELLERSSLMISHGGLGSIKESIISAVPLLVIPLMRDQPGNAARVKYHQIGQMLEPTRLSVKRLVDAISNVLNSDTYKKNILEMQTIFLKEEKVAKSLQVIRQYLD